MVSVASLPMHHWTQGDRMAEAHAMLSLVRCGYAKQSEVARTFGYTSRTLRNYETRYEMGGLAALGKVAGRPQETHAKPNLWVQTAASMQRQGMGMRDIAHRLKISKSTVGRWLGRIKQPVVLPSETTPELSRVGQHDSELRPNANRQGWSLDPDPANRVFDRLLARIGLLKDAAPAFIPGKRVPRAGVLLAVPALVQSGIFAVAHEVYGDIGPAFYGLRTTILTMLLLALLRIKRPEGLKEHVPEDLGRFLGLDRTPEVKTLRNKLSRLAEAGKAEIFGWKLAQRRVAQRGSMLGFLYVDGHVRVYHGLRRIPKAYATRMRLALPATTDYWINDKSGDPLFVVTAELNEGLAAMLPEILKGIRGLLGKRRVTIVFDRGGWSPKLFLQIIRSGFDILTYRKGRWTDIPRTRFATCQKRIEGRKVSYELNDKNIRLLKGRLSLRQITRLTATGHQTPIVTSRKDLPAVVLAYRMFERWRQENFFKYLREEYALDALTDYTTEPMKLDQTVPSPQRRKLDKELVRANAEIKSLESAYGEAAMANKEGERRTIRGFKIAHGQLGQQIRGVQKRIESIKTKRDELPKRVAVRDLSGEPLVRLSMECKHLTNCVKMVAYQAESDLLALVRPHYARADQEGRTLVSSALQSSADLEVSDKELRVTLSPLSSPHRSKAITAMCGELNRMNMCFPGSKLCLRFGVRRDAS